MPLEHHPLRRDFPEFETQLSDLLQADGHFVRLAQEYEALDKRIYEVEDGRVAMDEMTLLGLKMQRVSLKDEVATLLSNGAGG
ncbi:YdcH family protein [Pseudomonas sp. UBA2684]|uniref:YdcH family protein n=1 Tax=Pseudomonas sp. UBA2684 TaxID=1947311 RepID=UPI000E99749A|nr:YdcH family protein [Pseudomonas sp. UBA2684]HBX57709.1 GTP-binding protein [Pseudomonas sp.]|tara:strand:+ start:223 stop:471 length:249 start_codon:yes stop_codon:yes gene_type:complete